MRHGAQKAQGLSWSRREKLSYPQGLYYFLVLLNKVKFFLAPLSPVSTGYTLRPSCRTHPGRRCERCSMNDLPKPRDEALSHHRAFNYQGSLLPATFLDVYLMMLAFLQASLELAEQSLFLLV